MSNKYLEQVKQAGLISGIKNGWREASPSQKLTIGLGTLGGTLSAANMSNSVATAIQTRRRADLEEKSLKALNKINNTLRAQVRPQ